jgi:hypothetical protein
MVLKVKLQCTFQRPGKDPGFFSEGVDELIRKAVST